MEKQIYHDLAKAGNRYWWNQGRQYLVKKLFAQFAGGQQSTVKRRILDIGCAAGGTLYTLAGWGEVWGLDISPEAIALCRSWGIAKNRLVLGDAEKMACFSKDRFDLVTAVEIIEHLDNPGKALAEIKRVLKPGGVLILTVPADMRLWSGRDLRLGHKTRYTVEALTARVRASGLEVLKASYANAFYYWPYRVVLWWRRRGRQNAVPPIKTNTYDVHPLVNYLFALFLKIEAWIILKGKLPWGVSAVCVARKPLGRSRW